MSIHTRTPVPPNTPNLRNHHIQRHFDGHRSMQELIRSLVAAHT